MSTVHNISVIGDGGWGTTLAIHLAKNRHNIKLWGPFPDYIRQVQRNRYNSKFLPGIRIPQNVEAVDSLKTAMEGSDIIVFAVPSKFAASVLKKMAQTKLRFEDKIFVSATKGIDTSSLKRISELASELLHPKMPFAVLSGPTIAVEVAQGIPSSAVVASSDSKVAKIVQIAFHSDTFRIYRNTDVAGVELGGSVKNIIAIACGLCDGLGFGTNTKSAIITRGLKEMSRLGKEFGAKPTTFSGLSGLGDLITTCFSQQSRNRSVGEKLAQGQSLREIISKMDTVAEGVETVKAVHKLAEKHNVTMPITAEVFKIITQNKDPNRVVADLMAREIRAE